MLQITDCIYIQENKEKIFEEFEKIVLELLPKYNAKILFRIKPNKEQIIQTEIGIPFEIHILEFQSEQDFENFKQDETRKKFIYLKNDSVKSNLTLVSKS